DLGPVDCFKRVGAAVHGLDRGLGLAGARLVAAKTGAHDRMSLFDHRAIPLGPVLITQGPNGTPGCAARHPGSDHETSPFEPGSGRVKATWCSARNAGWQQVKMSRSWSSRTGPSSAKSSAPGPFDALATAPNCSRSSRPRVERRRASIARFRAVVTIHPAGLG